MFHWLAFQRQGRCPCSVPLVLRARLYIFPCQNHFFLLGGPVLLILKLNVKRAFGLQSCTFPLKKQYFRFQNCLLTTSLGTPPGTPPGTSPGTSPGVYASWVASWDSASWDGSWGTNKENQLSTSTRSPKRKPYI